MIKVIEKFGAEWCGPCMVLNKTLSQVTGVEIIKYDADDDAELFDRYGIRSVPTMVFKDENDNIVKKTTGAITLADINKILEENA